MLTALRYLGYYWLIITALILAVYDWLVLRHVPEGIEWLQVALFVPGFILVAAGYRRQHRNVDDTGRAPAGAAPSFRCNESSSDPVAPLAQQGKGRARDGGRAALPRRTAQTRNFSLELAADSLIESVVKNADPLRRAALLIADKDGAAADALSRIFEASEAVRSLRSDESP